MYFVSVGLALIADLYHADVKSTNGPFRRMTFDGGVRRPYGIDVTWQKHVGECPKVHRG